MDINQGLVTIITPNYNKAKYINDTIKSVLAQKYTNWELIIIDDCSTDNSLSIIKENLTDHRIKLISQSENQGVIAARNKGIGEAKGRYIAFLDSDDKWVETKLERQIEFMRTKNVAFSYTSYDIISSTDEIINTHIAPEKISYNDLLITCDIGCSTVVYDTAILNKQQFDSRAIKAREDYVLWLSIAKKFPNSMLGLNESLVLYRKHAEGISSNKFAMVAGIWKVYRDCEKLHFALALYYITRYCFKGLTKHYFTPHRDKL